MTPRAGSSATSRCAATNPLVLQPLSTGITYQIIPKVTADGIPLHTMGYGRTSAADGTTFEWVFNYPGTYWDAASIIVKYLLEENGGSLEGKKITLALSQLRLWQGADPDARGAGEEARLRLLDHRGRQPRAGAEVAVAADPPRAAGLRADVGLGGDELGGGQRGGGDRVPDGPFHRRLVVGGGARRAAGGRGRGRLQGDQLHRGGDGLSRSMPT